MIRIKKVVEIFGWLLFACLYAGLIIAFLWWWTGNQSGIGIWNETSVFGKIGMVIIGIGSLCVYTIIMLFIQMAFEALWIATTRKIKELKKGLKRMELDDNVQ